MWISWLKIFLQLYDSFMSCLQDVTLKEAETIALSILKQVMEEKVLSMDITLFDDKFLARCTVHRCLTGIPFCLRWQPTMWILRRYLQTTIFTRLRKWKKWSVAYEEDRSDWVSVCPMLDHILYLYASFSWVSDSSRKLLFEHVKLLILLNGETLMSYLYGNNGIVIPCK